MVQRLFRSYSDLSSWNYGKSFILHAYCSYHIYTGMTSLTKGPTNHWTFRSVIVSWKLVQNVYYQRVLLLTYFYLKKLYNHDACMSAVLRCSPWVPSRVVDFGRLATHMDNVIFRERITYKIKAFNINTDAESWRFNRPFRCKSRHDPAKSHIYPAWRKEVIQWQIINFLNNLTIRNK